MLDVPKPISGQILPRAIGAPIVEKNLSEINSAPGRQASSMLRSTQIRSLATPLSAISTVTSLAETNPGVAMSTQGKMGVAPPDLRALSFTGRLANVLLLCSATCRE